MRDDVAVFIKPRFILDEVFFVWINDEGVNLVHEDFMSLLCDEITEIGLLSRSEATGRFFRDKLPRNLPTNEQLIDAYDTPINSTRSMTHGCSRCGFHMTIYERPVIAFRDGSIPGFKQHYRCYEYWYHKHCLEGTDAAITEKRRRR